MTIKTQHYHWWLNISDNKNQHYHWWLSVLILCSDHECFFMQRDVKHCNYYSPFNKDALTMLLIFKFIRDVNDCEQ